MESRKMNPTNYNPEELEILDFIENENPKSVPDLANEIAQLKASVKVKISQVECALRTIY